jgi:CRISPR-associated protein Csy1
MPNLNPQRVAELRALIADFLKKRLDDKLDKIKDDAEDAATRRADLQSQYLPSTWLDDAAQRVAQIQVVTHTLKPIHPDARGSSLYSPPDLLPALTLVGSHVLGPDFAGDVVGNAAALDVYKLLKLDYRGTSLLALMQANDPDLAAAFSSDEELAQRWMAAFAGIVASRGRVASHTQAKQIYWPAADSPDPHDDASFHLLAPLYASSLAHRVFLSVNEHRFGDGVKEARQARREGVHADLLLHDYPQMAVQKLGGTKPQNISQLNSERRGDNILLASLPPVWLSADVTPLLNTASMLKRYERRAETRRLVKTLLDFLKSDPARNVETRRQRAELVDALIDELLQFAAELRCLPPGWSQHPDCDLSGAEKHWLDPQGVAMASQASGLAMPTDSAERISHSFANWLNAQLRDPLPMSDTEFIEWRGLLLAEIEADDWEGVAP